MIRGTVNADREPEIVIKIHSSDGNRIQVRATVETGFSGFLSLPTEHIERLGLPFLEQRPFTLGDDTEAWFDIYEATVEWDGKDRDIQVIASEGKPGVGMLLLYGFRLLVDVVDGGEVIIEVRP
jgi:clan AA aspartic protease